MATLIVRGFKVRSASTRRYLVVNIRDRDIVDGDYTFPRIARIERRSDSLATARQHADRWNRQRNPRLDTYAIVVDSVTGEEVS